jgi:replication-associated recombination protein RarA
MYKALKNSLSSLSAEEDKEFHFHFVETKYLKRLVSYESDIIYGTKGVGKTALRRALAELNGDFFFSTITIDLDSISFEAV